VSEQGEEVTMSDPTELSRGDGEMGIAARAEARLTRREREILALVAEGLTNAEIGAHLWISCGTVRRHLENAYPKLGVHTRTAAIRAVFG
jgi:DNA-binding NarL/FixJ family response regulator